MVLISGPEISTIFVSRQGKDSNGELLPVANVQLRFFIHDTIVWQVTCKLSKKLSVTVWSIQLATSIPNLVSFPWTQTKEFKVVQLESKGRFTIYTWASVATGSAYKMIWTRVATFRVRWNRNQFYSSVRDACPNHFVCTSGPNATQANYATLARVYIVNRPLGTSG